VVLAIIIWLITAAIRRRRAKRFDLDVAQAAAEAAATSRPPDFDDYDYSSAHGVAPAMYGYSDNSHGTFSQQPMAHDAYGMSELSGPTYGTGPGSEHNEAYYGAAGLGAGAMYNSKSTGPGNEPYNAYAAAPQEQILRYRSPAPGETVDWNDPALAAGGGYAVARNINQSQQSAEAPLLNRNRSQGANTVLTQSSQSQYTTSDHPTQPLPESYADHYKQGFTPRPKSEASENAYGGLAAAPAARNPSPEDELPNPFARDRPPSGVTDPDDSYEEHYAAPPVPRVLKVANE